MRVSTQNAVAGAGAAAQTLATRPENEVPDQSINRDGGLTVMMSCKPRHFGNGKTDEPGSPFRLAPENTQSLLRPVIGDGPAPTQSRAAMALATRAVHLSVAASRSFQRWLWIAAIVTGVCAWTPSLAAAAPSVNYFASVENGATLGAGTYDYNEFSLTGTEYVGHPDPITGISVRLPHGSTVTESDFPTCPEETLTAEGPNACPEGSEAGYLGTFTAFVAFGGEIVEEVGAIYPFFAAHGGLTLEVIGHTPVAVEATIPGTYLAPTSEFGPGWQFKVPLLESVPGAPYISFTYLGFPDSWFQQTEDDTKASIELPTECTSGWAIKTEVSFRTGEKTEETVPSEAGIACPNHTSRIATETTATAPSHEVVEGDSVKLTATVTPHETGGPSLGGTEVTFEQDGWPLSECEHQEARAVGDSAVAECTIGNWFGFDSPTRITAVYHDDPEYSPSVSKPFSVVTISEEEAAAKRKAEESHESHEEPKGGGGSGGSGGSGATATTAQVVTPVVAPVVAAPVVGQRQTVSPVSGTVLVRAKGASGFVALSAASSIADGSEVEATNGRVLVTVATPTGTETAEVYGGRFVVEQEHTGSDETRFVLSLPLTGCPRVALPRGASAASAKHGPKSRHLWVSESGGSWGTNGRYVSTTVEGTHWLTQDECNQSEVQVVAGKVKVNDLVTHKTKILTAGQHYTAKRR
jgi:hypothetical protein